MGKCCLQGVGPVKDAGGGNKITVEGRLGSRGVPRLCVYNYKEEIKIECLTGRN